MVYAVLHIQYNQSILDIQCIQYIQCIQFVQETQFGLTAHPCERLLEGLPPGYLTSTALKY
jgi:hypothetical protein